VLGKACTIAGGAHMPGRGASFGTWPSSSIRWRRRARITTPNSTAATRLPHARVATLEDRRAPHITAAVTRTRRTSTRRGAPLTTIITIENQKGFCSPTISPLAVSIDYGSRESSASK